MVSATANNSDQTPHCLRCGASLGAAAGFANCPVCQLPLWLSTGGEQSLGLSNPRWTARLLSGVYFLILAQLVALACLIVATFATHDFLGRAMNDPQVMAVCVFFLGIYYLLFHTGVLLHTMPEGRRPDRLRTHRWAMRIAASLGLAGSAIALFRSINSPADSMTIAGQWAALGYVLRAVLVASTLLLWTYLHRLARRLDAAWPAPLLLAVVVGLMPWAAGVVLDNWVWTVITVWTFWLYVPVSLVVLVLLARQLARANRDAQRVWGEEVAASATPQSAGP